MAALTHGHSYEVLGIRDIVKKYIIDTFLLGDDSGFSDSASLLDTGILDSTGAMELVAFLEETFGISVADHEITAENLDSADRICALIQRKCAKLSPSV